MSPALLCLNMDCIKVNFLAMSKLKETKWYEIYQIFLIVKY